MTADSPTTIPALVVAAAPARARLPKYALALLVVIYALSNIDRQIINILAELIRKDLHLHDWQIGMMTGFSFAILYAILGIPIARLAERANRSLIIATSVAVWSAFTALCGITRTFPQLILARIGVGIGEAGCTPATVSLISDIAPREKRASALAIYQMGAPIGALLGMAVGGIVADIGGWRMAFLVAAAPGLIVAALTALTLKEPRKEVGPTARPSDPAPTFKEARRELRACGTYVFFVMGGMLQAMLGYGNAAFLGSFFFRNHGEALARAAGGVGLQTAGFLGLTLGLISGIGGTLGAYIGGKIADHYVATDPRGLVVQISLVNIAIAPLFASAMLVGSAPIAFILLLMQSTCLAVCYGPNFMILQSVVHPRTRATAIAFYLLMVNLVGLGLGPVLVGSLSDYLSRGAGLGAAQGLRFALVTSSMLGALVAAVYWQARKHIVRDTVS
jgi:MFS family permease